MALLLVQRWLGFDFSHLAVCVEFYGGQQFPILLHIEKYSMFSGVTHFAPYNGRFLIKAG
jgi:hypothetical protein